jgi:amino acid adenylation domain-containing protein
MWPGPAWAIMQHYCLQPGDRVLQFASLNFDVAAEELFPTLAAGATIVLKPDQEGASFASFLCFLQRERLTVLNLPASFWHEWVAELTRAPAPLPPDLRLVIVGSESVRPERLAAWQQWTGDRIRWCNAYGTTETTVTSTIHEPAPALGRNGIHAVPVGRLIANSRAYILDPHHQPVPVGVPGELCIGGPALARGYHNRPDLTAERFIPDPFAPTPGARLYRTGDLARYLPDGTIEVLGRFDHQVKLRGFRIELGEIEACLQQHPALQASIVVASPGPAGEPHLAACRRILDPIQVYTIHYRRLLALKSVE